MAEISNLRQLYGFADEQVDLWHAAFGALALHYETSRRGADVLRAAAPRSGSRRRRGAATPRSGSRRRRGAVATTSRGGGAAARLRRRRGATTPRRGRDDAAAR